VTDDETIEVEQTIRIAASPSVVWDHWVDPVRLATWFCAEVELDARPGGRCRAVMEEGPVMVGEFVELAAPERLVLTFGWESGVPGVPPGSTRVEVTLAPDGDGTVLTLRHTELPAVAAADHGKGWAYRLPLLAERAAAAG
jgi:uncharacterized protein YndB with AHSA1/START domain